MISKRISSAMIFIAAGALSFATIVGGGCSSDAAPVYDYVDVMGETTVVNSSKAWRIPPIPPFYGCTDAGMDEWFGSEWECSEDYHYTCILWLYGEPVNGKNTCTEVRCGDRWVDGPNKLIWTGSNDFLHFYQDRGVTKTTQCTRVPYVGGTVHTYGWGWWPTMAGAYTAAAVDPVADRKVTVAFVEQESEPPKTCCNAGESYLRITFEGEENSSVLCVPYISTGYDLHAPTCGFASLTPFAYAKQSEAGFVGCPGGSHIQIVMKDNTRDGVAFVSTLCKVK